MSLVGFIVGLTISALVYVQYSGAQTSVMKAVADNVRGMETYDLMGKDDTPALSTERIAAPPQGSEARVFEIVPFEGAEEEEAAEAAVIVDEDVLPEDATIGEKISHFFEKVSVWLFGEKEEAPLEMKCSRKPDGGKVCSVSRG
ncbi:hypothetical protein [Celeribacter litoreus]|uniref:hypothetical protein n=1 Tax=Celeribacter litoreus TaxID=2876714 RepID=UPI001CC9EDE1|nr:hypothetical protein [Celeribacter litoreus]